MGILKSFYSWIPRRYPDPGTGNYAFQQNTDFINYDVRGAGRPVLKQFKFNAPQVLTTNVVTPEGLGGLFQGQYVSQPLLSIDPVTGQTP